MFRKHHRQRPRAGLVPTFEEFLQFVSATIPLNMTAALRKQRRINNHWKPVFLNCAPCSEPYEVILKMETFDEDVGYILHRLGLATTFKSSRQHHQKQQSAVLSIRNSVEGPQSAESMSQEESAVETFHSLDPDLVERVYQIYEPDFRLFGYDPHKYFNQAN